MRATFFLTFLASFALPGGALAGGSPTATPVPRPIAAAERAAVALAADFAVRGPQAVWERLDPQAPLYALGHDAALLEISARLGSRAGATWTLETPARSYGTGTAIFHLEFSSGVEDYLRLEFTGDRLQQLRTLVDRIEPAGATSQAGAEERSGPAGSGSGIESRTLAGFLAAVLALGATRRRGLRLGTIALLLAACSGGKAAPGQSALAEFAPRLGRLVPLRLELTGGSAASPIGDLDAAALGPAAARVQELWRAQVALLSGDLARAEALLGLPHPQRLPTSSAGAAAAAGPPLESLLDARAAIARFHGDALRAYDETAEAGFDCDGLRLEKLDASTVLDDENPELAAAGPETGSRLAEYWYRAAAEASFLERAEAAEAELRTAWSLRPLPRDEFFAEPALAAFAARPSLFPLFELGSPVEPIVRDPGTRRPLALPPEAETRLCGRHYAIRFPGVDLEIPGGAELAAADTTIQDAASFRADEERRALRTLATLRSAGAAASPVGTRLTEIAARSLARDGQWTELLAITGGENPAAGARSELAGRMRALALRQLGRGPEAQEELLRLAQRALAGRRPFPGTLYDLAELLAADGRYDTAIRLVRKADAQVARPFGEERLRQFGLSLELERDPHEVRSPHFAVRFPGAGGQRYGGQIATVLEEERRRLLAWIPQPGSDRVIVELLPLESFLNAYAGEVPVLGLFDGRMRMPLADIRSLEPAWIALVSHELTHAMLAAATRGLAPHWLQEGLAQHAETGSLQVNPMPALEAAGRALSFSALEPILRGFAEPQLVELAYSESAWVVAFVEARGGGKALRSLVDAYARGASTEHAIAEVLGQDPAAFDRAFRDWAVHRAPAKRLIAARRFDRELERPFAVETEEADTGRRQMLGMRVATASPDGPPAAGRAAAFTDWYAVYRAATAELRSAYAPVERIFRTRQGTPRAEDCAALRRGTLALFRDHGDALGAPDIQVASALRGAYEELVVMAESCEQGRTLEALDHYDQVAGALARAAALLRPYGLEP